MVSGGKKQVTESKTRVMQMRRFSYNGVIYRRFSSLI